MALADHRMRQEDWAKRKQHRAMLPDAYGEFLSKLADWVGLSPSRFGTFCHVTLQLLASRSGLRKSRQESGESKLAGFLPKSLDGLVGATTATCWSRA